MVVFQNDPNQGVVCLDRSSFGHLSFNWNSLYGDDCTRFRGSQWIFRSLGFSVLQSRISANLTGFVIWWVWLYCSSLGILYIKYIFRCGFRRYLLEDTLTASLLKKAEISLTEQSSSLLNDGCFEKSFRFMWSWFCLWLSPALSPTTYLGQFRFFFYLLLNALPLGYWSIECCIWCAVIMNRL